MRISDWSSDVCSSDLRGDQRRMARQYADVALASRNDDHVDLLADRERGRRDQVERDLLVPGVGHGSGRLRRELLGFRDCFLDGDRKSVVSGKSVSVRVDPGGRRTIKKKKK